MGADISFSLCLLPLFSIHVSSASESVKGLPAITHCIYIRHTFPCILNILFTFPQIKFNTVSFFFSFNTTVESPKA